MKAVNDEDVINKAYLDEKIFKKDGSLSFLEKAYNELKLHYNKQSLEEILIQRTVETTAQILYGKEIFDGFPNADEVLRDDLFVTRRKPDLDEINDVFH